MAVTLIILAATVVLMAAGKFRTDTVALGCLLALMLTGILTPQEALSGFSNNVIFVMAGMFVISGAIVRTGLASILSDKILGVAGKNTNVLFMLVMVLTAGIGSLVSNTGTVAIMMPIVVSLSLTIDESPSRFLMPLAFMSSIGGMFTMIGNSSNMVVNDIYVKAGYPSLSLLSFIPLGFVCFLFGILVLAPVTSRYLSRRKNVKDPPKARRVSMRELAEKYHISKNTYTLDITADSELAGKRLADLHLPEKYGVVISEVVRPEVAHGPFRFPHCREGCFFAGPDTVLTPGDRVHVVGSVTAVKNMAADVGAGVPRSRGVSERDDRRFSSVGICELVIMSASRLVNRSVAESGLRRQFGITVLGIQRRDRYILENVKDLVIQAGDALLVQGAWENLGRLEEFSSNWVVVGHPHRPSGAGRLTEKIPLVVGVIAFMLVITALSLVPVVAGVLLAATLLVVGGCFKNMDEVYSSMSWEPIVMMACLLPLAVAMEKTGVVAIVSAEMVVLCQHHGPYVALGAVYGIASALNIVISTTPVTLLLGPIAVHIAQALGYDPLPFLMAVTTGASMCFASPFSTASNALVMSAGRYTFLDYLRVGLPLQLLMGVAMTAVLPSLYPFSAA